MAYFNGFDDAADVASQFNVPEAADLNILVAVYETPSYEGYAFVLFEREGKLYEVNGSHCSCYGLEDQWGEEEVVPAALLMRVEENPDRYHYGALEEKGDRDAVREALAAYA